MMKKILIFIVGLNISAMVTDVVSSVDSVSGSTSISNIETLNSMSQFNIPPISVNNAAQDNPNMNSPASVFNPLYLVSHIGEVFCAYLPTLTKAVNIEEMKFDAKDNLQIKKQNFIRFLAASKKKIDEVVSCIIPNAVNYYVKNVDLQEVSNILGSLIIKCNANNDALQLKSATDASIVCLVGFGNPYGYLEKTLKNFVKSLS